MEQISANRLVANRESRLRLCLNQNIYKICKTYTKAACKASNDYCTGKLNYVKLIRESIWFALIDSRIDSVRNILICCTPNGKPTCRKWAGNLLVWSDLTFDPSFKVKRGWPNLKVLITRLLLVLEVWDGKQTYRKSWAGNLLMLSDLTLDPFFKVKQI